MKANAPEKVYLDKHIDSLALYEEWLMTKGEGKVEYTCTDTFIKKACDAYCKVCGHYPHMTLNHICRQACDYYKDFRAQIKGD